VSFEVKRSVERVCLYGTWFTLRQQTVRDARTAAQKAKEKLSDDQAFFESLELLSGLAVKDETFKTDEEAQKAFRESLEQMELEHYVELSKHLASAFSKKKELVAGP